MTKEERLAILVILSPIVAPCLYGVFCWGIGL